MEPSPQQAAEDVVPVSAVLRDTALINHISVRPETRDLGRDQGMRIIKPQAP